MFSKHFVATQTEMILFAQVKAYFIDVGFLTHYSVWLTLLFGCLEEWEESDSHNTQFYCIGVSGFNIFSFRQFGFFKVYEHKSLPCMCILSLPEPFRLVLDLQMLVKADKARNYEAIQLCDGIKSKPSRPQFVQISCTEVKFNLAPEIKCLQEQPEKLKLKRICLKCIFSLLLPWYHLFGTGFILSKYRLPNANHQCSTINKKFSYLFQVYSTTS